MPRRGDGFRVVIDGRIRDHFGYLSKAVDFMNANGGQVQMKRGVVWRPVPYNQIEAVQERISQYTQNRRAARRL